MTMRSRWLFRNLPNAVSILGVLPLILLFSEGGVRFLLPLLIYNNIMDDLDGQLAVKLDLKSHFGAMLDNVCDAVAQVIFVMVVGMSIPGALPVLATLVIASIMLRTTSRISSPAKGSAGTATNELMRHILLVLTATSYLGWESQPFLLAVFTLNAISMLVPYPMPHLIRSRTTTATGIALVNGSLILAWLVPMTAPVLVLCYLLPYLYSLIAGGAGWLRRPRI
jgi:phosphatidylglycerophosphate synthase